MKRKVLAYITHQKRLLILKHPFHPDAGLQVPGGTLGDNESPELGVIREAMEETGLTQLINRGLVGESQIDMSPWGKNETQQRYFFHLECTGDPPNKWRHIEEDPSEGQETEITFEFFWAGMDDLPELIARHDEFIDRLIEK